MPSSAVISKAQISIFKQTTRDMYVSHPRTISKFENAVIRMMPDIKNSLANKGYCDHKY